ncbi:hypothetical protein N7471_007020 [Penicillium samsonianum]|uniref:uncharacterized protein n=1 Tax=Penicillium samsonianum TaxID=1882272 RepID=UPI002546E13B|nr:uncharacterized protein N7471_007020 [Penicillium samsonianum]KAJ6131805.1 hypothetical protein N7471_007020 [Penicillium samsonianum]
MESVTISDCQQHVVATCHVCHINTHTDVAHHIHSGIPFLLVFNLSASDPLAYAWHHLNFVCMTTTFYIQSAHMSTAEQPHNIPVFDEAVKMRPCEATFPITTYDNCMSSPPHFIISC